MLWLVDTVHLFQRKGVVAFHRRFTGIETPSNPFTSSPSTPLTLVLSKKVPHRVDMSYLWPVSSNFHCAVLLCCVGFVVRFVGRLVPVHIARILAGPRQYVLQNCIHLSVPESIDCHSTRDSLERQVVLRVSV